MLERLRDELVLAVQLRWRSSVLRLAVLEVQLGLQRGLHVRRVKREEGQVGQVRELRLVAARLLGELGRPALSAERILRSILEPASVSVRPIMSEGSPEGIEALLATPEIAEEAMVEYDCVSGPLSAGQQS
jgi:hypothetical protein